MNSVLSGYIEELPKNIEQIPTSRIELLDQISNSILEKKSQNKPVKLVFICTHNSRRSHLAQIWASTLAFYFGIRGIETFSGGTEVTDFNIRAINALHRAGFGVLSLGGENPKYEVSYDKSASDLICYSKKFDSLENPQTDFAALMTCTDADQSCPVVLGAEYRFGLYYEDPKEADDTPWEAERYEERLQQIGTEIYYLMHRVSKQL